MKKKIKIKNEEADKKPFTDAFVALTALTDSGEDFFFFKKIFFVCNL